MAQAGKALELRPYVLEGTAISVVALALALAHLGVRADLAWTAEPPAPDAASCAPTEAEVVPLLDKISVHELRARLEGAATDQAPTVTVVDARPETAFEAGHIPGAISLPADQADAILGVQSVPIPNEGLVVTYCGAARCESAQALGLALERHLGCRNVQVLDGGWAQWLATGGTQQKGAEGA